MSKRIFILAVATPGWIGAIGYALWRFVLDWQDRNGIMIGRKAVWGRDFLNVWTAGKIQLADRIDILYDVPAYQAFQHALLKSEIGPHNYSYPPLGLPLTLPFGMLPYPVALALWLIATGAIFVFAARPWMREAGLPAWLALLLPASLINIWAGHYGFLMGAIWLFAWRALERGNERAGGVWIGLMALKPHLAILIPLVLFCQRRWRAIAWAAGTVLLLFLISVAIYGYQPWMSYLRNTTAEQARMIDAGRRLFGTMSTSPSTALLAWKFSYPVTVALQIALALIAAGMTILAAMMPVRLKSVALLTATTTFLVLPYAFIYDLVLVSLGALMIMAGQARDLRWCEWLVLYLGFGTSTFGFALGYELNWPLIPLMILMLAIVQYRMIRREAAKVRDPAARAAAALAR